MSQQDRTQPPPGYMVLDGLEDVHDGDLEDGRYGLYAGPAEEGEFLGCLDDYAEVVRLAWEHYDGARRAE